MSTERMLRAGQLAPFHRLAVRSSAISMPVDGSVLKQLTAALEAAQARADQAANKKKERTAAQDRCAKRIAEIRFDLLQVFGEYEEEIKECFESKIDGCSSTRVPIADKRYDHLASWRIGPRTEPVDVFVPLGGVVFVVDENDDHTDGEVLIFTRTATSASYSEEDAQLIKHPRFKETTTQISDLILDALSHVDSIRAAAEAKVGPIDERVVVAVLDEAGRRFSLNMAVAIDAQVLFNKRDIFAYDTSAIVKDVNDILRLFAFR